MPQYQKMSQKISFNKYDSVLDIQAKIDEESESDTPVEKILAESGARRSSTMNKYNINPFKTPMFRHSKTSEDIEGHLNKF